MKRCSSCKIEKDIKDFYNRSTAKDGKSYRCKECSDSLSSSWRIKNKDKVKLNQKRGHLKHRYKLSEEDYKALLKKYDNSCAICSTKEGPFNVDHCHSDNRVRGILCGPCNRGLGQFKDNPFLLGRAILYLQIN